ncbi:hypothetical protein [Paenibacillus sp. 1P03SA]
MITFAWILVGVVAFGILSDIYKGYFPIDYTLIMIFLLLFLNVI